MRHAKAEPDAFAETERLCRSVTALLEPNGCVPDLRGHTKAERRQLLSAVARAQWALATTAEALIVSVT